MPSEAILHSAVYQTEILRCGPNKIQGRKPESFSCKLYNQFDLKEQLLESLTPSSPCPSPSIGRKPLHLPLTCRSIQEQLMATSRKEDNALHSFCARSSNKLQPASTPGSHNPCFARYGIRLRAPRAGLQIRRPLVLLETSLVERLAHRAMLNKPHLHALTQTSLPAKALSDSNRRVCHLAHPLWRYTKPLSS